MTPVEIIGWIASILFAVCGAPQAYQSWKDGHSNGVSGAFMWTWLFGEVLMQIYVILQHGMDMILLVQYWANTLFVLLILWYKYRPRSQHEEDSSN